MTLCLLIGSSSTGKSLLLSDLTFNIDQKINQFTTLLVKQRDFSLSINVSLHKLSTTYWKFDCLPVLGIFVENKLIIGAE